MAKKDPTADALRALSGLRDLPDAQRRAAIAKGLASKSGYVVAKAARLAGEFRDDAVMPDLVAAFHRLMSAPKSLDKGCAAVTEIAAALYALDCTDPDVWLAGITHVQMEGSFGSPSDSAIQLRAHSAMGLAQTRHPDASNAIVKLLADPEPGARAGAARAIATLPSDGAALLLRYKVLIGDSDADVIADCFSGLLAREGDASIEFVAAYADTASDDIAEAAILALGASRSAKAIEWLQEKWTRTVAGPLRKTLLLALATARQDGAVEFLLKLLAEENPASAREVLDALRIFQHDDRIWTQVEEVLNRGRM